MGLSRVQRIDSRPRNRRGAFDVGVKRRHALQVWHEGAREGDFARGKLARRPGSAK